MAALADRAWEALQGGEYDLALNHFRELRLLNPDDDGIVVGLARCLRRMDRPQEAEALLELRLQQCPESLPLQLARLEANAEALRWQAVLRGLVPLVATAPDDGGILALLHQAAERLLPADTWSRDLDAPSLLRQLQPWLPQRWLLIYGLPVSTPPSHDPGLTAPALADRLAEAFDGGTLALVTDPTALAPLALWTDLIKRRGLDATVVLLSLHPLQALPWLQQRQGIDAAAALDLWLEQQLVAERDSRGLPRLRRDAVDLQRNPDAVLTGLQALVPPLALPAAPQRLDDTRLLLALDLHEALLDADDDHCRAAADRIADAWGALTPATSLQVSEHGDSTIGITYALTDWGHLHHSLSLLAGGLNLLPHHAQELLSQPRPFTREHDPDLTTGQHTFIVPFNTVDLAEPWFLDLSPGQCQALAEGRLRLFLDGSHELGDDALVQGLIGLLQRRGVRPDPSALHLICQNRRLSGAGWFTVLAHDHHLVRAWQVLRDQVPASLRQSLEHRDLLQTPAKLLCLNATPRPLRIATLLALLDSGLWEPEQRPNEHHIAFGGIASSRNPVRNIRTLAAQLKLEGFPDADAGIKRLERLPPVSSDSIDGTCWLETRVALVTESECRPTAARITEKTFKALALGHPTVVVGNPGSLDLARSLGFDVADDVIDPGYDAIDRLGDRCRAGVATAAQLLDRLPQEGAIRAALDRAGAHNRAWAYNGFQMHYARSHSRPIVDRLLWREASP